MTTDHQGAELRACPICGTAPRSGFMGDDDGGYHYVECPACDGSSGRCFIGCHGDSPAQVAAAWNRRPAPAAGGDDALAAAKAPQWLPIEQAPKDGTELLGWREDCGVMIIRWTAPTHFMTTDECERALAEDSRAEEWLEAEDWFCADFRLDGSEAPTHFMPLPAPPSDSAAEGGGGNAGSKEQ